MKRFLLITFILVPLANYAPFLLKIGEGRFADDATTRVDAAGYAFSVWGLIFLGMLLFAFYQQRVEHVTDHLRRAWRFLVLAGWASIAFVPISMTDNQLLGWIDLLWHLLALIGANVALRRHALEVGEPEYGWTYFAPSVYLGWISAATVISTALALDQLGVGFPEPTAVTIALGLIIVLFGIGSWLGSRRDGVYALTVAWALVAVATEQRDSAVLFWGGVAGAALLVGLAAARWLGKATFFYARTESAR